LLKYIGRHMSKIFWQVWCECYFWIRKHSMRAVVWKLPWMILQRKHPAWNSYERLSVRFLVDGNQ
jgi:hypothetical protein